MREHYLYFDAGYRGVNDRSMAVVYTGPIGRTGAKGRTRTRVDGDGLVVEREIGYARDIICSIYIYMYIYRGSVNLA